MPACRLLPAVLAAVLLPATPLLAAETLPGATPPVPRAASATRLDARLRALLAPAPRTVNGVAATAVPADGAGRVHVTVRVRVLDVPGLAAAGLAIERQDANAGVVEGWTAPSDLAVLAARAEVIGVHPVEPAAAQGGSVTTAGDALAGADRARAELGVDGAGVVVGVISDGIDALGSVQASGDLPGVPVPPGCLAGSGSEGTALLEIVHDLAPGAVLRFASGVSSALAFVDAVACLRDAGARVVVDDLVFVGEPTFEDGPVARAVRAAVVAGISYHTVAGNLAQQHWEGPYRPSPNTAYHDFTGGVDNLNAVAVPAGGLLRCALHWNERWGAAATDYDLQVLNPTTLREITASDARQDGDDDPVEIVSVTNATAATQIVGLAVLRRSGAARTLELVCLGADIQLEHVTPAGSIVGHAALAEAVTVGAVAASAPGSVRPYSGQGPSRIVFPTAEQRAKPDLVAFDGVAAATPGFTTFRGTSAAAPHTAAVAALLLERNPFLLPAEVRAALVASAVTPPGPDAAAGAGRLNAYAAVSSTAPPECLADAACADDDGCTLERCERGRCARQALQCDDGDPCNGAETCEPARGCVGGAPLPDEAPCGDATVCNGLERCRGGACRPGEPLRCGPSEACTTAFCDAVTGCGETPLVGAASVSCLLRQGLPACAGPRPPRSVARGFARARRTVQRAEAARTRRLERRRLRLAIRQLGRGRAAVARAERRGRLPPACAAELAAFLADAEARARRAAAVAP